MACSDNVVRAGLTPKFKDVETLVQMLTYTTGGPSIDAGAPLAEDPRILRYTPPVPGMYDSLTNNGSVSIFEVCVCTTHLLLTACSIRSPEFEVLILQCDPGDSLQLKIKNVPAIFVIIEGTGTLDGDTICQPGRCYYHPAAAKPITFAVPSDKRGPLKVAVAHRNLHLQVPTTFSRTPHGSLVGSAHTTPYPQSPHRVVHVAAQNLAAMQIGPSDYIEVPKDGSWH